MKLGAVTTSQSQNNQSGLLLGGDGRSEGNKSSLGVELTNSESHNNLLASPSIFQSQRPSFRIRASLNQKLPEKKRKNKRDKLRGSVSGVRAGADLNSSTRGLLSATPNESNSKLLPSDVFGNHHEIKQGSDAENRIKFTQSTVEREKQKSKIKEVNQKSTSNKSPTKSPSKTATQKKATGTTNYNVNNSQNNKSSSDPSTGNNIDEGGFGGNNTPNETDNQQQYILDEGETSEEASSSSEPEEEIDYQELEKQQIECQLVLATIREDYQEQNLIVSHIEDREDPIQFDYLQNRADLLNFSSKLRFAVGRSILSRAVINACREKDAEAVLSIISYVREHQILVTVSPRCVHLLMYHQQFRIIIILLESRVQVRQPVKQKRQKALSRMITHMWETQSIKSMGKPSFVEKYLKASDFIKSLLYSKKVSTLSQKALKGRLVEFLVAIQDFIDHEEILQIFMKHRIPEVTFEFTEDFDVSSQNREIMIIEAFRYFMMRNILDLAVMIWENYDVFLIKNSDNVIESIIQCFDFSPHFLQIKLYLLDKMVHKFKYQQVERLLNAIEKHCTCEVENCYLVQNVNPILTGVNLLDTLTELAEKYTVCEFRVSYLSDLIMDNCRQILIKLYMPIELKIQVRQKNIVGRNAMYYMEKMDAFDLMETKVMDRIMKEYWRSNIDTGGSIFEMSSTYRILTQQNADKEIEEKARFYKKRKIAEVRPNQYIFVVFINSMQMRYFLEVIIYIVLAFIFQYEISIFNDDLHKIRYDFDVLASMEARNAPQSEIDHELEIIHEDIHHAAVDLDTSMFVAMTVWTYPLKILTTYYFAYKSDREYSLKVEDYFDLGLTLMVILWVQKFYEYSHLESTNTKIASTPEEIFMYTVIQNIDSGKFHFDFLLAAIAGCFWFRLLLVLKLTKTFGPMIKIIIVMLKELVIFVILWVIQLFIFTCVGILVFGELPQYLDFFQVLVMFFESSMGQWDLTIYDNLKLGSSVGQIFHLLVIILNLILLLNLVIAILSETYVRFANKSLGLYYDGVIEAIPAYQYNKWYGGIICAIPPFNLLLLPILPIYLCTKNPDKLKSINTMIAKAFYLPFSLLFMIFFAIGNLLMIPIAYPYAIIKKIRRAYRRQQDGVKNTFTSSGNLIEDVNVKTRILKLFWYIIAGPIILLLNQFADLFWFCKQLFHERATKLSTARIEAISIEAFNTIEAIIKREMQILKIQGQNDHIKYQRQKQENIERNISNETLQKPPSTITISSIRFIKMIRKELEIVTCIRYLIFGKFLSMQDKDQNDQATKKKHKEIGSDLSLSVDDFDSPLYRIKIFNLIKKIVLRMQRSDKTIDLQHFANLIQDIRLKMNIEIVLRQSTDIKHSMASSITNSYASGGLSSGSVIGRESGDNVRGGGGAFGSARQENTGNFDGKLVDTSHKLISKSAKFLMDYQIGEVQVDESTLQKHYYYLVEFSLLNPNRIFEALDSTAFAAKEKKLKDQYIHSRFLLQKVANELTNVIDGKGKVGGKDKENYKSKLERTIEALSPGKASVKDKPRKNQLKRSTSKTSRNTGKNY